MIIRRLLIAVGVVYGLALIGAAIAPRAMTPSRLAAEHDAAGQPAPARVAQVPDPLVGFAINFHHTQDVSLYLRAIDEIAALGFNSVEIVTPAFQDHGASQTIRVEYEPGKSPTREHLIEVLAYARGKGLSTTLMPIVLFASPRGNEWRGKITPEQWEPWWRSYRQMTDYFLDIAIAADVQVYCVGSELLSTETTYDPWQKLIAHVRSRFKGKLIYSTNWDHYHVPTFWKDLDYIGISGYWNLTTLTPAGSSVDPDHLARRWVDIRSKLMEFSASQRRPVIITEIGYPTLPWALKSPWNYVAAGDDAKADPEAQATGYRAFLAAWEDLLIAPRRSHPVKPPLATTSAAATTDALVAVSQPSNAPRRTHGFQGFYFYAWDVYHQGGPRDTGYGIRNKPSYHVVKSFMTQHGFRKETP